MTKPAFDIAAARRLVDAIAADLEGTPAGAERHAQLRSEVARLKTMLADADAHPPAVEAGMRSVHTQVERTSSELQSDGVRAGMFLQDIARMLGLD